MGYIYCTNLLYTNKTQKTLDTHLTQVRLSKNIKSLYLIYRYLGELKYLSYLSLLMKWQNLLRKYKNTSCDGGRRVNKSRCWQFSGKLVCVYWNVSDQYIEHAAVTFSLTVFLHIKSPVIYFTLLWMKSTYNIMSETLTESVSIGCLYDLQNIVAFLNVYETTILWWKCASPVNHYT